METEFRKKKLMVIDDDHEMLLLLKDFFSAKSFEVFTFSSAIDALDWLAQSSNGLVDLVISDIKMPKLDGFEFVRKIKNSYPKIPVLLVTAFGSIDSAIEAMRLGAHDYLVKPFKLSELSVVVDRALEFSRLRQDNQLLREQIKRGQNFGELIGRSKPMRDVFDLIDRVSRSNANVLIMGESGTGKEMVARAIHERGERANKPFVAINCTAIPENLLESELFGHAKGSFTGAIQQKKGLFEEAEGGTLFLDEIGDMDTALQVKLLRVIQEKKIRPVGSNTIKDIDVRIISATHKDLKKAIKETLFREDLYYRLSVIPILIPPLRHRKEDIPALAEYFLKKFTMANQSKVEGFSIDAMKALAGYHWPGNVRELENVIERAIIMTDSALIEPSCLPVQDEQSAEDFFGSAIKDFPTIELLEKRYIELVMKKTGFKKDKAAQILGINRRTLYRKEREYGFNPESLEQENFTEKQH